MGSQRRLFRGTVMVALLACIVTGAASASADPRGPARNDQRKAAAPVTVSLLNPASGARVARSQRSPVLTWRLSGFDPSAGSATEELQVSSDPTFRVGGATQTFACTSSGCATSYQWKTSYWFLESDTCTYIPPQGSCSRGTSATGVLYWRVSLITSGGTSVSPTGRFQLFRPKDATPPHVLVLRGSAQRGTFARFEFYASDETGPIKEQLGLYSRGRLVLRAHHGWGILPNISYLGIALPGSVRAGAYRWCLTAFDQAGNHAKSCALYVVGA